MNQPILKTPEEIERMRRAGRVVAKALRMIETMVAPGVTTAAIDTAVEELIRKEGGIPAFKGYPSPTAGVPNFPSSICASINEEVVHGIPCDRRLLEGDIFSVDVGVQLDGFFGDAARTFPVGIIGRKAQRLLDVTKQCLQEAIAVMRPGERLGRVSQAIQRCAESRGYTVVRKFVGHGVGRAMHEPPQVPNFVSRHAEESQVRLQVGMVLAIEPMVNIGKSDVLVQPNGWTVITKDRSLSAHVEDTLAIGPAGILNLTEN